MIQPPEALWQGRGVHPTGTTVLLSIHVCKDDQGQIWSFQQPATPEDARLLETWQGHGTRALAHVLLVEALRREAHLCLLTALSKDTELVQKYLKGNEAEKEAIEHDLAVACMDVVQVASPKIVPDAVREIMNMAVGQAGTGA